MSRHNEIGRKGENLAKDFLEVKGYKILEQNWRYSRAEVDLIAEQNGVLIFIEVKTRTYDYFGPPEEFVNKKKMKLLSAAATAYMEKVKYDWEIRFDIISVLDDHSSSPKITHFEDAFFPGL